MDYFNDVLLHFWALNTSVALLSMPVRKLSDFIRNILTSVPKMNEDLAGLKRHEGELTGFSFLGELSLLTSNSPGIHRIKSCVLSQE